MVECESVLVPCCRCHRIPMVIKEDGDLWYVVCGCKKWDVFEFLGKTKRAAIDNWNLGQRPIKRTGNPK